MQGPSVGQLQSLGYTNITLLVSAQRCLEMVLVSLILVLFSLFAFLLLLSLSVMSPKREFNMSFLDPS
jgi:hypothetical protein